MAACKGLRGNPDVAPVRRTPKRGTNNPWRCSMTKRKKFPSQFKREAVFKLWGQVLTFAV
jgi:hypothetical protein